MKLKPVATEKAVKMIDVENTLLFETDRRSRKEEITKQIESLFEVKVYSIRTLTRKNRKYAYVRLAKPHLAANLATKLGMI